MWESKYSLRLFLTDLAVIITATALAQILRFGIVSETELGTGQNHSFTLIYIITSSLIALAWVLALYLLNSRKREILGAGSEEYRRVVRATLGVFALVAVISYLGNLQLARGYVLVALPLGLIGLLVTRWLWRQWLIKTRRKGEFLTQAVIIGSAKSADEVAHQLITSSEAGFEVLGCFLSGSQPPTSESQQVLLPNSKLPILGGYKDAINAMRELGASTIIVANSDHLSPVDVRSLSWKLIPGKENLVVAPSILDVSGPRLNMYPVASLSLILVQTPQLSGMSRFLKRLFDVTVSLFMLILLIPLFLVIAILIKISSPGPIFFTQNRIGLNKRPFKIYKFRTMQDGAHLKFDGLARKSNLGERGAGNEVQFKLKEDPRVTALGSKLRKYSLDELPQLFNVLFGSMSLVGPRPHVETEVRLYDKHVYRRLFVKPGITGLWQVSGRSSLDWTESVRKDLSYVENWSLTNDFLILMKTFKAVFMPNGAY